jgi:hypothetical protein
MRSSPECVSLEIRSRVLKRIGPHMNSSVNIRYTSGKMPHGPHDRTRASQQPYHFPHICEARQYTTSLPTYRQLGTQRCQEPFHWSQKPAAACLDEGRGYCVTLHCHGKFVESDSKNPGVVYGRRGMALPSSKSCRSAHAVRSVRKGSDYRAGDGRADSFMAQFVAVAQSPNS